MKENRYERESFTEIVKRSINLSDVARNIGLSTSCGNRETIKKYINVYGIDISHFHVDYSKRKNRKGRPLSEILVLGSTYNSNDLKKRLYKEGLKERKCEKCGQGEEWYGEKMALILDHINGEHTDNRIENLRIVCPNCNATLLTHGGKNVTKIKKNSMW